MSHIQTSTVVKPVPVSLKTSIAKVDAKSIGVAAEGLSTTRSKTGRAMAIRIAGPPMLKAI